MFYTLTKAREPSLGKSYHRAVKELNAFFGLHWVRCKPRFLIIDSRAQMDEVCDDRTPDWMVGHSLGHFIVVLALDKFGKESAERYSKRQYEALLKHELCHLFLGRYVRSPHSLPRWISEGTCLYLAGQLEFWKRPKKFQGFLGCYRQGQNNRFLYAESGFAVEILVESFGKKRFLRFLKGLKAIKNRRELNYLFQKIYGFAPAYKIFNRLMVTSVKDTKMLEALKK